MDSIRYCVDFEEAAPMLLPEIGPNLFWVSTRDRQGNWFVIARTARAATRFFVEHEGYIVRSAKAEIIAPVPFSLRPENGPSPCFAQIDDLKKVAGIEIVDDGKISGMRKVSLSMRMFVEGDGMVLAVTGDTLCDPTIRFGFEKLP
jgi:hypothetical protein